MCQRTEDRESDGRSLERPVVFCLDEHQNWLRFVRETLEGNARLEAFDAQNRLLAALKQAEAPIHGVILAWDEAGSATKALVERLKSEQPGLRIVICTAGKDASCEDYCRTMGLARVDRQEATSNRVLLLDAVCSSPAVAGPPAVDEAWAAPATGEQTPNTVFVVDDEKNWLDYAVSELGGDFSVRTFADEEEIRAALQADSLRPSAFLIDWILETRTGKRYYGEEFVRWVRQAYPDSHVIVCTSGRDRLCYRRCDTLGATYVEKRRAVEKSTLLDTVCGRGLGKLAAQTAKDFNDYLIEEEGKVADLLRTSRLIVDEDVDLQTFCCRLLRCLLKQLDYLHGAFFWLSENQAIVVSVPSVRVEPEIATGTPDDARGSVAPLPPRPSRGFGRRLLAICDKIVGPPREYVRRRLEWFADLLRNRAGEGRTRDTETAKLVQLVHLLELGDPGRIRASLGDVVKAGKACSYIEDYQRQAGSAHLKRTLFEDAHDIALIPVRDVDRSGNGVLAGILLYK